MVQIPDAIVDYICSTKIVKEKNIPELKLLKYLKHNI